MEPDVDTQRFNMEIIPTTFMMTIFIINMAIM